MADKKALRLKIITPEKIIFDEEVDQVVLPSLSGEIGILPGHARLMSALGIGPVVVFQNKEEKFLALGGGYCEVNNDVVTILADSAEHATDLNEERALKARQRAQELMENKEKAGEQDQAMVAAALQRSLARLKVLERHHRKHGKKSF